MAKQKDQAAAPAEVHFTLQGKGGVGKSAISTWLAQFKQAGEESPRCVDTDPVNATLLGFEALDVHRLEIMAGDEIDSRSFDQLIELIAAESRPVIVDNGAATFVPLASYMLQNYVPELITGELNKRLVIHSVITGGQALQDTLYGFEQLVKQFPEAAEFIVWLNPYFGPVEKDGVPFEEMPEYVENRHRVRGIVYLPDLKKETFGHDIREMMQDRLTFEQAIASDRPLMVRQRLKMARDQVFQAIAVAMG